MSYGYPTVRETSQPFGALIFSQVAGVRHPGCFFLPTLVKRSTVVNWFIKHFPSVPLVCLQRQHLSTYLVLCYAAVRDLNTVHAAMFKSRVLPSAFWKWPDHCAGEKSCDAPQTLHAELSPPFFLAVLTFDAWPAVMLKTAQSALHFSHGDLQREATYASCFTQVFLHSVHPSLGSYPWLRRVEDQKEHLKYIKARWSVPLCN